MAHAYEVQVVEVASDDDIPGRFGETGLRELVGQLGGTVGDHEDVWAALRRTFEALPPQTLAERLLDLVLLKPPIPAGCEALVRAMADPASAPWRTHEVREDRVWLWYCHRLLHRALPEDFPPPTVTRLRLRLVPDDASARPPGRRTPAHDRVTFVARLLAARPGALREAPVEEPVESWAFDVLWSVEVGERSPLGDGRHAFVLDAWLPDVHVGALADGDTWRAEA